MAENITPAGDRTVVVTPNRFGLLTILSLSFNALILLLILAGIVCHHHRHHHHFHDRGEFSQHGGWNGGDGGFHHHGFGGMHGGWGGATGQGGCCGGNKGPGHVGGPQDGGFHAGPGAPGEQGGPGFGGPGATPQMPHPFGMMGGGMHMQLPTASGMTDHVMQHLDTQLALTDQENTQIRPIVEAQVAQLQKDMETERQALAKSVEDTTAKIRPMLTADQQKQLDQIKTTVEEKLDQVKPADAATSAKPKE